jgi:hypothetical protein
MNRYDASALRNMFAEAGTLAILERKGFHDLEVVVDCAGRALPHTLLVGHKGGARHVLLDTILGEAVVGPEAFARQGFAIERPIELMAVYWLREEDPTAAFAPERPALPLQHHPGLGVLRSAFRVVVRIANELGKDGVASSPKFFHDAVIFFRSRLFLFLDGKEQGRFQALLRDLQSLNLGDASLAILMGSVRDASGVVAQWTPSFQVFPLGPALTAYLNSPAYADLVERSFTAHRFRIDRDRWRDCPDSLVSTDPATGMPGARGQAIGHPDELRRRE